MVPRREIDVSHAGLHGELRDRVSIEGIGTKLILQPLVFPHRDLLVIHHPLATAQETVETEVQEQAEPRVAKPPE